MDIESVIYEPIGVIHTPFMQKEGVPIQPAASRASGTVELDPAYKGGLKDLDGFSHIYLIYHFHLSVSFKLQVTPFLDDQRRGVFSTRAPKRPNQIGISVVELTKIEHNILYVKNVDMVNGTPLLDIKPYVGEFEDIEHPRIGWLTQQVKRAHSTTSDNRFD